MKVSKDLKSGDKVYIESIYGEPYHGVIVEKGSCEEVVVKRDDQEYPRFYNHRRLTKDEEE